MVLGTIKNSKGRIHKAIKLYKEAIKFNHNNSCIWYNLGVAYSLIGDKIKAAVHYKTALAFKPTCAEAFNNLGILEKDANNLSAAIKMYKRAIKINPSFSQAYNNLGVVYTITGMTELAHISFSKALELDKACIEARSNLGVVYRDIGRIDMALQCFKGAMETKPDFLLAHSNYLLTMNYGIHSKYFSSAEITAEHRKWGRKFENQEFYVKNRLLISKNGNVHCFPQKSAYLSPFLGAKIRVGYVSADLVIHSVSYFIEVAFEWADRERFEVFAFSNSAFEDKKTAILKKAIESKWPGNWVDVFRYSGDEQKIAEVVYQKKICVLVDLSGHTAGNLLGVFALKPAPIQISWIGYPNTIGMECIDFRVSDHVADPLGEKSHVFIVCVFEGKLEKCELFIAY